MAQRVLHVFTLAVCILGLSLLVPHPASAAVLGDLSQNGRVGVEDALLALRIAVGLMPATPYDLLVGDVYPPPQNGMPGGDGKITLADALRIIQYVVGLLDNQEFGTDVTRVAITDSNPQVVQPGGSLAFHLGFTGTPPLSVQWSVVGGPTNGTISQDGTYTAPVTQNNLSVTIQAVAAGLTATGGAFVTPDAPPPPP